MEKEKEVLEKEQKVEVQPEQTVQEPTEKVEEPKKEKKGLFNKKEDLEKKKLQDENNELKDKLLRVSAEMQNMMRRNEEKIATLLKYEGEDLIKSLLPVVDNFERAISMDDANLQDEVSKFLEGFKMIYGNLNTTFQNHEIMQIEALHQPFDPNTMEAVLVEEVEGIEPNMVIYVLQKGYTYKGKVIRHAMVKVSK
jgi:molecular chaperone GrpE